MVVTSGRKSKGREERMSGRQRRRLRTRRRAERSPRKEASSVAETPLGNDRTPSNTWLQRSWKPGRGGRGSLCLPCYPYDLSPPRWVSSNAVSAARDTDLQFTLDTVQCHKTDEGKRTHQHAPFILQAVGLLCLNLNNLQQMCHSYYTNKII